MIDCLGMVSIEDVLVGLPSKRDTGTAPRSMPRSRPVPKRGMTPTTFREPPIRTQRRTVRLADLTDYFPADPYSAFDSLPSR
ncbi:hypothetical protein CTU88_45720, partial [Streptomyces sp. JV178]